MNTIEANSFNCIHKIESWTKVVAFLVLRCASAEKVRAALCRLGSLTSLPIVLLLYTYM